jgi:hypothetical protein
LVEAVVVLVLEVLTRVLVTVTVFVAAVIVFGVLRVKTDRQNEDASAECCLRAVLTGSAQAADDISIKFKLKSASPSLK